MSPDLDAGEYDDDQDQSEVFDEDNTNLDERRTFGREDAETLEELPDVFDVTAAEGDDDDDEALIGEELDDEEIIALEQDIDDDDDADIDTVEDLDDESGEEVELEYVGDLGELAHARSAAQPFESRRLSDEDLRALRYSDEEDDDMDGLPRSNRENDVEGGLEGPRPDRQTTDTDLDQLPKEHPRRRQDELLDEGVEETFPASDPVSVKRIT